MKPKASDNFQINRNNQQQKPGFKANRSMRHANGEPIFPEINLSLILRHLWLRLCKLFVALRYSLYKATGGMTLSSRLPWFKLGLVAFAIFILTKKDIQFSINMKAPLAGMFSTEQVAEGTAVPATQKLSIMQPLSFSEKTVVSNRVASPDELDVAEARAYIKRFKKVAITEMQKFNIPASIKMGQGLLESMAGQNTAAIQSNNHFGPTFGQEHFDNAWASWRAHSLLIQRDFNSLASKGISYKPWAKGLEKLGYSSDTEYAEKLIEVIERYQLYLLDEEEI